VDEMNNEIFRISCRVDNKTKQNNTNFKNLPYFLFKSVLLLSFISTHDKESFLFSTPSMLYTIQSIHNGEKFCPIYTL